MPKYVAKLTVPAANTKLNPVTEDLKISQGRIAKVSVTWTSGSQWLNAFIAKYEGAQIIPSEGGGQIRGNGVPDEWDEHIIIKQSHPVLNLEAWNEGNDHEHDCLFSVVVVPLEEVGMKPVRDLVDTFKRMLGY